METESTAITAPSTLLEELVERTRLSLLQLTVVVELVLITFLVGTAYLDGVLAHPFDNARTGDGARQSDETVPGVERAGGAGEIEDTRELLDSIKAWTAHEEWVRKLPEWPYTGAIKRNLALSLFLPVVVGIIRETLSGFLRRLLPLS